MKVSGFRCDICNKDYVSKDFVTKPMPCAFTANTQTPGSVGFSWSYNEICEDCELEIRKAINGMISALKLASPEEEKA